METIVKKISNSRNPLLAGLFGLQAVRCQYDPEVNAAIIKRVERKIYGEKGLEGYEKDKLSERCRLAARSLAQFLCQRALIRNRLIGLTRSFIFLIALFPLFLYLLVRSLIDARGVRSEYADVVIFGHYEEFRRVVVPLFSEKRLTYCTEKFTRLSVKEVAFLIRVIADCPRILMHPGLLFNFLRWLSYYGYVVYRFKPQTVVNFFEGVASSSLMTAYLHERGTKHINQMHGERFPSALYAFCEFDEFNVWGAHFKEQFMQQRCPVDRFVITGNPYHKFLFDRIRYARQPRPKRLLIIQSQILSPGSSYYFSLLNVLKLVDPTWEIRFRPHYNEVQHGLACFDALQADKTLSERGIQIELEHHVRVSLEDALVNSRVVVGAYSTAMLEGWVAGCKVIHLKGEINRDAWMKRYGGSANVLYADDDADLEGFLDTPAVLTVHEDKLVDHVTAVLDFSPIKEMVGKA